MKSGSKAKKKSHIETRKFHRKVTASMVSVMKKLYYIALKNGETCEGIICSSSVDRAREELTRQGMEHINIAILRSDDLDFLDIDALEISK